MIFETVIVMMDMLLEDSTTSKSVREKVQELKSYIETSKDDTQNKISKVLSEIDEMSADVNLPPYVRTHLYSLSSELEALGNEI